ncbi:response regulator [bacterium]|nr:response regulator [bacterium]MBU1994182.1 response regulator [bacterium]
METSILQMIKEDAKNVHVLIAEDDLMMQGLYRRLFHGIFHTFTMKSNGAEAYDYFCNQKKKPVDLIISDNYMPQMNGMELVQKIREKDFNVRIIVMTSEEDLNLMRTYMLNGVDAILPKPYNEDLTMKVLQRTLHYINEKKLLEHYVEQLESMARENVARKSEELKNRTTQERTPRLNKIEENETLVQKYKIRNSINDMENVDVEDLDVRGKEKIDNFREKIAYYELLLCSIENYNIASLRLVLKEVLEGVRELIKALDIIGVFPVASQAATHLIKFVENLEDEVFTDISKQELFIDILVTMLEDFDKWIDLVFISKTTDNIHYFDASFANTCLELEIIFKPNEKNVSDEDTIEFF